MSRQTISPIMTQHIAYKAHNHQHCIDAALDTAHALCRNNGVRLTPLREEVLKLVWNSHQPLGAYALMDMLSANHTRRVAPPTVYRALEFLAEQGLVHKIHTLNAFVGCTSPEKKHDNFFLICTRCQSATECDNSLLHDALQKTTRAANFKVDQQSLEILGVCPRCHSTETHPS